MLEKMPLIHTYTGEMMQEEKLSRKAEQKQVTKGLFAQLETKMEFGGFVEG